MYVKYLFVAGIGMEEVSLEPYKNGLNIYQATSDEWTLDDTTAVWDSPITGEIDCV